MQTKNFEHAGVKYQIERHDNPPSFWKLYQMNEDGSRTYLGNDPYQNDIYDKVRSGKYTKGGRL